MRGWGGGGSTTALDCHFLIRLGSTPYSRVSSVFSIAMVFITHNISFPAQLLKPTAPTHLQHSHSALSMETRSPWPPSFRRPGSSSRPSQLPTPPLTPCWGPDKVAVEEKCEQETEKGTAPPHPQPHPHPCSAQGFPSAESLNELAGLGAAGLGDQDLEGYRIEPEGMEEEPCGGGNFNC